MEEHHVVEVDSIILSNYTVKVGFAYMVIAYPEGKWRN
jgi:hypothetical protein